MDEESNPQIVAKVPDRSSGFFEVGNMKLIWRRKNENGRVSGEVKLFWKFNKSFIAFLCLPYYTWSI